MILISNHVLFPFMPQWKSPVDFKRTWQNEISDGVLGNETRFSLRAAPRRTLSFELINLSLPQLGELNDAILAAKKSGFACAPFHGRAQTHALAGEDNLLQLVETGWTWRVGDFVFLRKPDDSFEIAQVESSNLEAGVRALTLADPLTAVYPAESLCWPIIFGKLTTDTQSLRAAHTGPIRITIEELTSPASTQLGELAPPDGAGIGSMTIGSTFTVA